MKFSLRELDLWLLPKVRFLRSLPLVLCFTGDTKLWRLPNESEGSLRPRTFRLDLEEREKIISQNCVCSCFTSSDLLLVCDESHFSWHLFLENKKTKISNYRRDSILSCRRWKHWLLIFHFPILTYSSEPFKLFSASCKVKITNTCCLVTRFLVSFCVYSYPRMCMCERERDAGRKKKGRNESQRSCSKPTLHVTVAREPCTPSVSYLFNKTMRILSHAPGYKKLPGRFGDGSNHLCCPVKTD